MKINGPVIRWRTGAVAASLAVLGALATGCGDDSSSTTSDAAGATPAASASPSGTPSFMSRGMPGMPGMMNNPSATPADKIAGAKQASFALLDTRPPGTDAVKGTTWLAQSDAGTTLTVTMTGLKLGANYMGHLHAQACSDDNGGPHFKFDASGPDTPPNEVHIGFAADANGMGMATVTNDRKVGDAAKAIVIHPADAMDNRLACADF